MKRKPREKDNMQSPVRQGEIRLESKVFSLESLSILGSSPSLRGLGLSRLGGMVRGGMDVGLECFV